MTFAYTVNTDRQNFGGLRIVTGNYTNTNSGTGGTINTGLSNVYALTLTQIASSASSSFPVWNTSVTPPMSGSDVVIVTASNDVGVWVAFGE